MSNAIEIEYRCNYKYLIRNGCDFSVPVLGGREPLSKSCKFYSSGHCTNPCAQKEAFKEEAESNGIFSESQP